VVVGGFIVAHLLDVVAYQPRAMIERPWILLNPASGLSSFGGFLGALFAMLIWSRRNKLPLLPLSDSLLFGLAYGWFFGRLGCFTAHDHPGDFTSFFLGVRYPEGTRHDLGLDEALVTGGIVILFTLLARAPRRLGLYAALACLIYGPVRFALDFLRVRDVPGADPRYFGLTPAQYGAIAVTVVGLALAVRIRRERAVTPPATATATSP
jgi:phosphatidylglycerol:prolipoprotein diacylglycerol transferase